MDRDFDPDHPPASRSAEYVPDRDAQPDYGNDQRAEPPADDRSARMRGHISTALAPLRALAETGDIQMRPTFAAIYRALQSALHVLVDEPAGVETPQPRDETAFSISREGQPLANELHRRAATEAMKRATHDGTDYVAPDPADLPPGDAGPSNAMVMAPPPAALASRPAPDPTLPPRSSQIPVSPAALQNVSGDRAEVSDDRTPAEIDQHGDLEQPAPGQAAAPEGEAAQDGQQGSYAPQPEPVDPFAGEDPVERSERLGLGDPEPSPEPRRRNLGDPLP